MGKTLHTWGLNILRKHYYILVLHEQEKYVTDLVWDEASFNLHFVPIVCVNIQCRYLWTSTKFSTFDNLSSHLHEHSSHSHTDPRSLMLWHREHPLPPELSKQQKSQITVTNNCWFYMFYIRVYSPPPPLISSRILWLSLECWHAAGLAYVRFGN